MDLSKTGKVSALFGLLALSACQYEIGKASGTVPEDLSCHSNVLNQTIKIQAGEKLLSFSTNKGQPYFGLSRKFKDVKQDGAMETTVETKIKIKMYDHDRWHCTNAEGKYVDYKNMPKPNSPS